MHNEQQSMDISTDTARSLNGNSLYRPGLDRIQEAVISSHFMHVLANDRELELFTDEEFDTRSVYLEYEVLFSTLLPSLLAASSNFASQRAGYAKTRAKENHKKYGLQNSERAGTAHFITEAMFDREYQRGNRAEAMRPLIFQQVQRRLESCLPIQMVIPALPFKFSSPLKTRGQNPDLAEINFIFYLYEIAATIDLLYKEGHPHLQHTMASFTVVSDGKRFNKFVGEREDVVDGYRAQLAQWIRRIGLHDFVHIVDYRQLVHSKLPKTFLRKKAQIVKRARVEYEQSMWPVFDPLDMDRTFARAPEVEPDPETSSPEGRFAPLLKSLVYTINYKCLDDLKVAPVQRYNALYRELTAHIFEPFDSAPIRETPDDACKNFWPESNSQKEALRNKMLVEAWIATIKYMAEIKGDRELKRDPIIMCLPEFFRWTIHGKPGQLALMTSSASGIKVQAWAGSAVLKTTRKNKLKLCTLPVLALEGVGAIPVRLGASDEQTEPGKQPLLYIYPDIKVKNIDELVAMVSSSLIRNRAS